METHPRISIIIPVFNIALYLNASVRSVLNQSFTDFELLLMDDGSTDGSGELCNTLAEMDSRIRVLHLSHRGASAARNAGIEAACGDYIGFVDGDDWIEPDMYALLHENSVTYESDLSACGFVKITDIQAMAFSSARGPVTGYTRPRLLKRFSDRIICAIPSAISSFVAGFLIRSAFQRVISTKTRPPSIG